MINKSDFFKLLEENETIKRYRLLEEKIHKDKLILEKLDEIKTIQKNLVHAEEFGKEHGKAIYKKNRELIIDQLSKYPLLMEYLDLQQEINNMLGEVKEIIEDFINKEING